MITRETAYALLTEHTKNPNLVKHALAVEAAMRHYAKHFGKDEETWGIVGLIHDFDYEQYPDLKDHPFKGVEILRTHGWPEALLHAVLAHAPHTGTPRENTMDKAIFSVDELSGFIIAVALVRPNKKLAEVDVEAVKKKMKEKSFAKQVNREEIREGAAELKLSLDEHIQHVLTALQTIAPTLGL